MRRIWIPLFLFLAAPAQALTTLTLDQAIQRALATHPTVRIDEEQVRGAALSIEDAKSSRMQASFQLSALDGRSGNGVFNDQLANTATNNNTANATVGFSLPLFTGFKLSQGIAAAERGHEQALAQRTADQADLVYRVSQAFHDLRRRALLEGLRQEALGHAQKNLELARKGYALGRTSINEVNQEELNLMSSQVELLQSKTQTSVARSALANLLALPQNEFEIDGHSGVDRSKPEPISVDRFLEDLPLVKAAKAKVEAEKARVGGAKGDLWPQLSLDATYQHGNNPYDTMLGVRSLQQSFAGTWNVRLTTNFNLWDSGKTLRNVWRAEGELRIAEANLAKTRQDTRAQVEQILTRLDGAYERMQLAEKVTRVAEQSLAWIEKRYEQGYALQIEVNQVRSNWISLKTQAIDALTEYEIARAELKRSLGAL